MEQSMEKSLDQLYELLPVVYRQRDAEQGYPLRALMQVITEQVHVVEEDIGQLYENWFIETCEDWLVPYLGDLVGYRIAYEAGEPGDVTTPQGQLRNKILIPRRDVANTIRYRRRKGTLALLELLANDVAGWSARAVEFYRLLGWTQSLNHLRTQRGRTVDLRNGDALDHLNTAFEELAHTVDVRRINSHRQRGRTNIPSVGLFVWRLKAYSATQTPAYYLQEAGINCYTFSVLGNDTPLYVKPEPEARQTHIAGELNAPTPIRRRALERRITDYYGEDKSFHIWLGVGADGRREVVPAGSIVAADLTNWQYRPKRGYIAVDPVLGRIAFPSRELPKKGLWVSYHYGFSADIGGGEYNRPLSQPADYALYRVVENPKVSEREFERINDALDQWETDQPANAVIEIANSGVYVEQINIRLKQNQSLQLRAANRTRPVIRLLDWQTDRPDSLWVQGTANDQLTSDEKDAESEETKPEVQEGPGGRIILDGLLITGRGVQLEGKLDNVTIRHCTLVPGWSLNSDCRPRRSDEASLELFNTQARVTIENSIVGSIQVSQDEVKTDPIPIHISDSILDATDPEEEAIGAPEWPLAHATLTILRSTVFGYIQTHAIDLAENSIFDGLIKVGRSQRGCMRFCYVTPGSRTPRRYNCQPDLVKKMIAEKLRTDAQTQKGAVLSSEEIEALQSEIELVQQREALRVRPQFNSTHYGTPTYCQLAETCAEEIKRGADDESEIGVFHDLYQPQRAANLLARLEEYTPAGMDVGIIYAS